MSDERAERVIMCEPRQDCADKNTNRWYCERRAKAGNECPLLVCIRRGANRRQS